MTLKKDFSPFVFYTSAFLLLAVLILCLVFGDDALQSFKTLQSYFSAKFGWFYVLSATIIFFSVVFLLISGFAHLFGFSLTTSMQIAIIAIITLLVSISVSSGIDRGIKFLSNLNMILAVFLMLFILFFGSSTALLKALVENTGNYLASFVGDTFNLYAYEKKNEAWLGGWTLFY